MAAWEALGAELKGEFLGSRRMQLLDSRELGPVELPSGFSFPPICDAQAALCAEKSSQMERMVEAHQSGDFLSCW